jgi:hypothetical protein
VGLERGPLSLVSATEELLERKRSGYGLDNREYGHRDRRADYVAPSIRKVGTNYTNNLRSLVRYSSLANSGHGVFYYMEQYLALSLRR